MRYSGVTLTSADRNRVFVWVLAGLLLSACTGTEPLADRPSINSRSTGTFPTVPDSASVEPARETSTSTTPAATTGTSAPQDGFVDPRKREPVYSDAQVLRLAADLGVRRFLVRDGTDVVAVEDGVAVRWVSPEYMYSDGTFIYWTTYVETDDGTSEFSESVAATFDWGVVCRFDDWSIHHVTERADGSFVAGVERPWGWADDAEVSEGPDGVEVPAFAAECSDGSTQEIASFRGYGGETESWRVERVADRVFRGKGDAEGNAEWFNESEVLLTEGDITANMLFNADGSIAVHDSYAGGWAAAPRIGVRARNTNSGALLWSADFEVPISSLDYNGDRVFVGLIGADQEWTGWGNTTGQIVILDGVTGDELGRFATTLNIRYVE